MDPSILLSRLRRVPVLRRLPLGDLDRVVSHSVVEEFGAKQVLLEAGTPAVEALVLLEGRASIRLPLSDGEDRLVAVRSAGDWIGEMGLLDGGPRSARVVAEEAGTSLRVPGRAFLEMVAGGPPALDLLRAVVARLRESDAAQIELLRGKTLALEEDNAQLRTALAEREPAEVFFGSSAAAEAVRSALRTAAACDLPVLVAGETGTGKELVARAIHAGSARAAAAFVPVNCALLSESLLESALFGHARGAFTGAASAKPGLVEAAHGGTLFLDELADTPAPLQAALLRFLESGEFRRVGETRLRHADVRLVAATQLDPDEAVRLGRLRADLRFRVDVLSIRLPPLRERREDVGELAVHLAHAAAQRLGVPPLVFSPAALEALTAAELRGNARELRNEIERLHVRCPAGGRAEAAHLSPQIRGADAPPVPGFREAVRAFKARLVLAALGESGGNVSRAAERLGLHRSNLSRMMRDLGIEPTGRPPT